MKKSDSETAPLIMRFPALSKRELKELLGHHLHRRWLENFLRLRLFRETFGRFPRQKEQYPKGIRIGSWSHKQRLDYRSGKMPEWRVRLLTTLDFDWGNCKEPWDDKFKRAQRLQKKKGAPLSRYSVDEEERLLKQWLYRQVELMNRAELPEHRKRKLITSGLATDRLAYRWQRMFTMVKRFIDKQGRIPSAHTDDPNEKMLGKWRLYNIDRMNDGLLNAEQSAALRRLGLDRKIIQNVWEEKFASLTRQLDRYFSRNLDQYRTGIMNFIGNENYIWWRDQRRKYRNKQLDPSQRKRIKEAGLHLRVVDYIQWRKKHP